MDPYRILSRSWISLEEQRYLLDEILAGRIAYDPYNLKFLVAEVEGREALSPFLWAAPDVANLSFHNPVKHRSSCYDMLILSAGTRCYVECKLRSCTSGRYDEGMIDAAKWTLLQIHQALGNEVFYASLYRDEVALIWNVRTKAELRMDKDMPVATSADRGRKPKLCAYLPTAAAQRIISRS